jgi:hypothetical protein
LFLLRLIHNTFPFLFFVTQHLVTGILYRRLGANRGFLRVYPFCAAAIFLGYMWQGSTHIPYICRQHDVLTPLRKGVELVLCCVSGYMASTVFRSPFPLGFLAYTPGPVWILYSSWAVHESGECQLTLKAQIELWAFCVGVTVGAVRALLVEVRERAALRDRIRGKGSAASGEAAEKRGVVEGKKDD